MFSCCSNKNRTTAARDTENVSAAVNSTSPSSTSSSRVRIASDTTDLGVEMVSKPKNEKEKTLYCIRHAQSEYNETVRNASTWVSPTFWMNGFDPRIRDPKLSILGQNQVNALHKLITKVSFCKTFDIELIVTSPLTRAMQTCLGLFKNNIKIQSINNMGDVKNDNDNENGNENKNENENKTESKTNDNSGLKAVAYHELREWMDTYGDVGQNKKELLTMNEFSNYINFDELINDEWWLTHANKKNDGNFKTVMDTNGAIIKETKDDIHYRIQLFKEWILQRPENNIVVIGHSRFFREFVGSKNKLHNCQMMRVHLKGMDVVDWNIMDLQTVYEKMRDTEITKDNS